MPATLAARAGSRRFGLFSATRAHIKASYKVDLLWETLGALNRPGRAQTARSTFCTSPASHAFEFGFATPGFTSVCSSAESDGVDAGAGAGAESDGAGADAETADAENAGPKHQCGSGSGHHFGAAAAASPLYSVSFGSPAAAGAAAATWSQDNVKQFRPFQTIG